MRAGWLAFLVLLTGCVFRDAEPRYFRPGSAAIDGAEADPPPAHTGVPIRLRQVRSTPFLRERIVWRASAVEYGFYEEQRWSEPPASYVERALQTALRRTPGIRLTDDLHAAALQIDVVAFDDVLSPARVATVTLIVLLRDGARRRLLDRTFSAEAPITGPQSAATAEAMGRALDQVVAEVAAAVAAAVHAG
jgi:ABC-type uncharacterized transport system auxiliary subunit